MEKIDIDWVDGCCILFAAFMKLCAMRELGIRFAGSALKMVELSTVTNAAVWAQIRWLKKDLFGCVVQ